MVIHIFYLFDERFYQHSCARVKQIEENSRYIQNETSLSFKGNCAGDLIFPDHYKYFFIRFHQETNEKTLNRFITRFNFLLPKDIPEIKSCASFGFNFPSVSFYPSDEKAGHFFRFCPGTISKEKCRRLGEIITEIFSNDSTN